MAKRSTGSGTALFVLGVVVAGAVAGMFAIVPADWLAKQVIDYFVELALIILGVAIFTFLVVVFRRTIFTKLGMVADSSSADIVEAVYQIYNAKDAPNRREFWYSVTQLAKVLAGHLASVQLRIWIASTLIGLIVGLATLANSVAIIRQNDLIDDGNKQRKKEERHKRRIDYQNTAATFRPTEVECVADILSKALSVEYPAPQGRQEATCPATPVDLSKLLTCLRERPGDIFRGTDANMADLSRQWRDLNERNERNGDFELKGMELPRNLPIGKFREHAIGSVYVEESAFAAGQSFKDRLGIRFNMVRVIADKMTFKAGARDASFTDSFAQQLTLTGTFPGFELVKSDARNIVANRADLRKGKFFGSNLVCGSFVNAKLEGADLRDSILRDADLTNASLIGADFRRATLIGANFTGSSLINADFTGSEIDNTTQFAGAALRGVRGLDCASLKKSDSLLAVYSEQHPDTSCTEENEATPTEETLIPAPGGPQQ